MSDEREQECYRTAECCNWCRRIKRKCDFDDGRKSFCTYHGTEIEETFVCDAYVECCYYRAERK